MVKIGTVASERFTSWRLVSSSVRIKIGILESERFPVAELSYIVWKRECLTGGCKRRGKGTDDGKGQEEGLKLHDAEGEGELRSGLYEVLDWAVDRIEGFC